MLFCRRDRSLACNGWTMDEKEEKETERERDGLICHTTASFPLLFFWVFVFLFVFFGPHLERGLPPERPPLLRRRGGGRAGRAGTEVREGGGQHATAAAEVVGVGQVEAGGPSISPVLAAGRDLKGGGGGRRRRWRRRHRLDGGCRRGYHGRGRKRRRRRQLGSRRRHVNAGKVLMVRHEPGGPWRRAVLDVRVTPVRR